MSSSWVDCTLGDVLTLQRGFDLPESEREPGPFPVIASTGQVGSHKVAMVKGPGVVIGRSGSIGGGQYISSDFWPLNTTLWVKDFKGNDKRFCYYLLKSLDFTGFNVGSGVPTLNRNHIHPHPVRIPKDPVEQHAIGHILGTMDDKIELNSRINETLEAMVRAVFKSWFVDFDPVRARSEGREPVGMDAETAALFPDSFEETDLGMVPKGWGVGSFDKTIDLIGGGTPKTSAPEYWNGDVPWFSIVDAPKISDVFVIDTEKKITKRGLEESSTKLLLKGTTIITARGTVGKCALVGIPMTMNQSCYGVHAKDQRGDYFIYFALRNLVSELQRSTHGSVFDTITTETFKTVQTAIVPIKLTRIFDKKISLFMERILSSLQESKILVLLRNSLIPKLLSGEIPINSQRIMEGFQ